MPFCICWVKLAQVKGLAKEKEPKLSLGSSTYLRHTIINPATSAAISAGNITSREYSRLINSWLFQALINIANPATRAMAQRVKYAVQAACFDTDLWWPAERKLSAMFFLLVEGPSYSTICNGAFIQALAQKFFDKPRATI